jgi:hypothetical protein
VCAIVRVATLLDFVLPEPIMRMHNSRVTHLFIGAVTSVRRRPSKLPRNRLEPFPLPLREVKDYLLRTGARASRVVKSAFHCDL